MAKKWKWRERGFPIYYSCLLVINRLCRRVAYYSHYGLHYMVLSFAAFVDLINLYQQIYITCSSDPNKIHILQTYIVPWHVLGDRPHIQGCGLQYAALQQPTMFVQYFYLRQYFRACHGKRSIQLVVPIRNMMWFYRKINAQRSPSWSQTIVNGGRSQTFLNWTYATHWVGSVSFKAVYTTVNVHRLCELKHLCALCSSHIPPKPKTIN